MNTDSTNLNELDERMRAAIAAKEDQHWESDVRELLAARVRSIDREIRAKTAELRDIERFIDGLPGRMEPATARAMLRILSPYHEGFEQPWETPTVSATERAREAADLDTQAARVADLVVQGLRDTVVLVGTNGEERIRVPRTERGE